MFSRRRTLLAGVGGFLGGSGWAAIFGQVGRSGGPTIEVTGKDESQLIIVDAGSQRVLIVAGPSHPDLLDDLDFRMGLFRQRIDVLLATQRDMAAFPTSFLRRWNVSLTAGLPGDETGVHRRARYAITEPLQFRLAPGISLTCLPQHRLTLTHPTWRIKITYAGQTITIAANLDDLLSVPAATLAIAPAGILSLAIRKSVAANFAINSRHIESQFGIEPPPVNLVPIFERDVARFGLHDKSIRLPEWTRRPEPRD